MADWRQIQARIRKAKNSADPSAKLSELYQRTRDGMVAWEIGAMEEKNGRSEEAVKWYKVAADKFRRADWKKKAEEALARLGVESSEKHEAESAVESEKTAVKAERIAAQKAEPAEEYEEKKEVVTLALGEIAEEADEEEDDEDAIGNVEQPATAGATTAASADNGKKKRRRGRRGGRGRRRRTGAGAAPDLPAQAFASSSASPTTSQAAPAQPATQKIAATAPAQERAIHEAPARERDATRQQRSETIQHAVPQLPSERAAHGRSDPALSSRMAHLESLLRRLMSSPLHKLGEADEAPAGPGVFLLSDTDQTSSYYIEACQTLRVGVGNLVRGVRAQKGVRTGRNFGDTNLKERLGEYLGVNEAKVSQYLKEHCVVRWIQLDDEASHLAHFAIGLLKTPLNDD